MVTRFYDEKALQIRAHNFEGGVMAAWLINLFNDDPHARNSMQAANGKSWVLHYPDILAKANAHKKEQTALEKRKERLCKGFKSKRGSLPAWTNRRFLEAFIIPMTGGTSAVLDCLNSEIRTHPTAKAWTPLPLFRMASHSMVLRFARLTDHHSTVPLITPQDLRHAIKLDDPQIFELVSKPQFNSTMTKHGFTKRHGIYHFDTRFPLQLSSLIQDEGRPENELEALPHGSLPATRQPQLQTRELDPDTSRIEKRPLETGDPGSSDVLEGDQVPTPPNTIPSPAENKDPSQMAHRQQPNLDEALKYMAQVRVRFNDQPDVYNRFVDIMKDFKIQAIDTPGFINRVLNLFNGHSALIQGIETFLPPGYHIESEIDENRHTIRVTTPSGTTTQCL